MSPERIETEVDGRRLSLSNLDKVLYPETGFTKGELLNYYARVAPVMLPHLRDRPVTLRRFPNGVEGHAFFEKHAPAHTPEWVRRVRVPRSGDRAPGDDIEFVVIDDRPTLIWAANLAAIELHTPLWSIHSGETLPAPPDTLVFDLDPGPGTTLIECCAVAVWIRDLLDREGLAPVMAKTSGSKGLQLYVPVSQVIDWPAEQARAHELAQTVERDHPDRVVTNMRKALRENKVLIDWSQNHPTKTTVAVYSLRALSEPSASTPVTWDEIATCSKRGDPSALRFMAHETLDRVERDGDLFAPLLGDA